MESEDRLMHFCRLRDQLKESQNQVFDLQDGEVKLQKEIKRLTAVVARKEAAIET